MIWKVNLCEKNYHKNPQNSTDFKSRMPCICEEILGERWDFPDSTGKGGRFTSGNTAWCILHFGGRDIVV